MLVATGGIICIRRRERNNRKAVSQCHQEAVIKET